MIKPAANVTLPQMSIFWFFLMVAISLKVVMRPYCSDDSKRDAHEENIPPVESRQNSSKHEPQYRARQHGHLVQPEGFTTLVRGKCISENRGAVGEKKRRTYSLNYAEKNDLQRAELTGVGSKRKENRSDRVDRKPQVV